MVPSLSPSDPLLSPNVEGTSGPTVMPPLTPAQPPLTPSVAISIGSAAALCGRTSLSARAPRRQQASDNLVHLLSVASLTDSPPLVEDVVGSLSSITQLHATKRADLDALLLLDGSATLPDDVEDLISIA